MYRSWRQAEYIFGISRSSQARPLRLKRQHSALGRKYRRITALFHAVHSHWQICCRLLPVWYAAARPENLKHRLPQWLSQNPDANVKALPNSGEMQARHRNRWWEMCSMKDYRFPQLMVKYYRHRLSLLLCIFLNIYHINSLWAFPALLPKNSGRDFCFPHRCFFSFLIFLFYSHSLPIN